MRHPREREHHTRGRRRQRIPQRVVQLGRRAMRWHVVVLTVCAASFSFLCCCVVCWQRNVFGLGVVPPCSVAAFCSVKSAFLSRLLYACSRAIAGCEVLFRKRAPLPITCYRMYDAHLQGPYYTLNTSD